MKGISFLALTNCVFLVFFTQSQPYIAVFNKQNYQQKYKQQMKAGRRLTIRREQARNPRSGLYDEDPEVVKEICDHIIRHNNPTGLLHQTQKWIDPSELNSFEVERITTAAFRNVRKWKSTDKGTTINSIKGRPFWLKVGNVGVEANNFQKVFQSFYSYQFQDKLGRPLLKPSEVGFNPLARNPLAKKAVHRKNLGRSFELRRKSADTQEIDNFHNKTIYTLKPPKQYRTRQTRQTQQQEFSKPNLFQQCNRIVTDCSKILSAKGWRTRVKTCPHRTIQSSPVPPSSPSSSQHSL